MARRDNRWHTPDSTDIETLVSRCLTVPLPLLPAVSGALSELTKVWNWQEVGTLSPDDAAYFSTVMLEAFVGNECGVSMLVRQNEFDACILEFSNDQGVTWFEFANLSLCATEPKPDRIDYEDIRENPTTGEPEFSLDGGVTWTDIPTPPGTPPVNPWTPPLEPIAASDDTERICIAASTAVYNLSEMYRQTYGAIGAGVLNTLDGLNDFLYDLNHFLAEIVWGQYYDVIAALGFFEDYESTQYAAAALDAAAQQALLCLLIDNAAVQSDNTVTFDFGGVRDNVIVALGLNPGTAVWTHLNYVQETGLNRLGNVGFAAQMDCYLCDDLPEVDYEPYRTEAGTVTHLRGNWYKGTSQLYTGNHKLRIGFRRKSDGATGVCGRIYDMKILSGPYTLETLNMRGFGAPNCTCGALDSGGGSAYILPVSLVNTFPYPKTQDWNRGDRPQAFEIAFRVGPCIVP